MICINYYVVKIPTPLTCEFVIKCIQIRGEYKNDVAKNNAQEIMYSNNKNNLETSTPN